MSDEEEKTTKYYIFYGEAEKYDDWAFVQEARSHVKKYAPILNGTKTLRTVAEMAAETDQAKKDEDEKIVEMNNLAFSNLVLSIDSNKTKGKRARKIVRGTKSADYPNGNAKLAWDKLKEEYEPTTNDDYVSIKADYHNCKLTEKGDPIVWITQLGEYCDRLEDMGHAVSEEDQFIHIIGNLPFKYLYEQRDFNKRLASNTLTMDGISQDLRSTHTKWKKHHGVQDEDDDSDEDEDVALINGQFKGYCNNCGKYGHKKANCPELTQQQQGRGGNQNHGGGIRRFNGKCYHCGKRGHRKSECRSNPENQGGNNNSNNESDDDEVADVMLMAMEPP